VGFFKAGGLEGLELKNLKIFLAFSDRAW